MTITKLNYKLKHHKIPPKKTIRILKLNKKILNSSLIEGEITEKWENNFKLNDEKLYQNFLGGNKMLRESCVILRITWESPKEIKSLMCPPKGPRKEKNKTNSLQEKGGK